MWKHEMGGQGGPLVWKCPTTKPTKQVQNTWRNRHGWVLDNVAESPFIYLAVIVKSHAAGWRRKATHLSPADREEKQAKCQAGTGPADAHRILFSTFLDVEKFIFLKKSILLLLCMTCATEQLPHNPCVDGGQRAALCFELVLSFHLYKLLRLASAFIEKLSHWPLKSCMMSN